MAPISGKTQVYGILADPIHHVQAPQRLNEFFASIGFDGVMIPIHVRPDNLPAVVAGLRGMENLGGVVVTVPHKTAILALCDAASEVTRKIGAATWFAASRTGVWSRPCSMARDSSAGCARGDGRCGEGGLSGRRGRRGQCHRVFPGGRRRGAPDRRQPHAVQGGGSAPAHPGPCIPGRTCASAPTTPAGTTWWSMRPRWECGKAMRCRSMSRA